ncbi:adenosine 3'-phospho 5'-phosphosulfate transporter 2 [Tribolium madens]|uniref:adenosine 3'-phospho 5'-phosphosulfate transporter 2 n=1 Tax=Tribolium madens TaxID=41895 RepID=UPI001CF7650C|nr:adenosine 3'-phospho 5'-phosphosulfate transporter 2 [Tribolium madens]
MSRNNLRGGLNPEPDTPKISILCLDITHFSQPIQFFICSGAVFVFFILYGYMQELIFTIDGFQPFGWYLTLVQFGFYSVFGLVETRIRNITSRSIPLQTYFLLALLTLGTMGFSNASLGYLNYPTQVIFKCCKLIPVLVGSILIQGKRYGPLDFSAAVLMCVGLTLFTLADSHVQPNFNTKGIFMISMALLCDAIIGNVQEKSMKNYGAPNSEVVLFSYSIGFLYLFIVMVATGDFTDGLQFFATNPKKLYGYALIFSLTGYLGIQIVLTLVRTCGAFAAVTVTTCRKAVTIIISFVFFSKPFTFQYLWSGLVVVLGIYLNLFSKKHPMSMQDLEVFIERCIRAIKLKIYSKRQGQRHYTANV